MIDFEPTEEQALMVTAVSQLASKLRERIRQTERDHGLPAELRLAAFEMGLGGGVAVPESHGGAGLGLVTAVLLDETLAGGDPAAPFALGGPGALAGALHELGTPAQASEWLGKLSSADRCGAVAWSEPRAHATRAGFCTTATRSGDDWVLSGVKAFVLNADRADAFVVFAQVDEAAGWAGMGAFIVERAATGLTVGERKVTLGLDAVGAFDLKLDGVKVGPSARLAGGEDFCRSALRFFVKEALKVSARAVGLSQAAFDASLEYVTNRRAFGKPIGHFQAVAFTLADRAMDLEAARHMVRRSASLWDAAATGAASERDALLASAQAVSMSLEGAMRAGDDAVQLHGGAGFMRDYPVEKYMRDAKQLGLCSMTKEQADQLGAAVALGVALDPAVVLPTPDLQAVFT
jgi:alkylation response protein AidB-like acyl-CoA dehydrogenase